MPQKFRVSRARDALSLDEGRFFCQTPHEAHHFLTQPSKFAAQPGNFALF
jgi:hypothetical protein